MVEGKNSKIPYVKKLCPWKDGNTELQDHKLLYCNFYQETHNELLTPLLSPFLGLQKNSMYSFFWLFAVGTVLFSL